MEKLHSFTASAFVMFLALEFHSCWTMEAFMPFGI